ncbi:kinesin-like protein KIF25 isoform X3 [Panthera onca]
MPAAMGGRWGRFWEQRARQLQRQVQAKEEWIVDLETENAVLHLRLAQYQGAAGQSGSASAGLCSPCGPRARLPRSPHAALLRLRPVIQALKQDVKALHASFLEVFRNFWDHLQTGLSEVAEGVQRAQLQHQALLSWRSKAGHLERCLQEADSRYQLEKQRRKVLHNRLVETVLVKCDRAAHPPINNTYSFERVYGPAESQQAVFGDVRPLLTSLLDGYNVCIMAYGQTGCGKSYTMLGPQSTGEPVPPWEPHSDLGVLPRAAGELFRLISENPSRSLKVDVSIVEVYNNDIFDLLAKDGRTAASGPKREALTAQEAKPEVCLLTREPVHSAAEFMALAAGSLQLRAELATSVHANSSRSHLIITATLTTAPARGSPGKWPRAPGQGTE